MFKKVVIADRVAPFVNAVYQDPTQFPGISLLIATFFFAFQIYCDFSGYSDIAIGAAQVMGFDLMKNFRQPYFSSSVGEFWRSFVPTDTPFYHCTPRIGVRNCPSNHRNFIL